MLHWDPKPHLSHVRMLRYMKNSFEAFKQLKHEKLSPL